MKNFKALIIILALAFIQMPMSAQKKIKFSKGTLRICSSKNFTITGYNGNEVIIKSLHGKRSNYKGLITSTSNNLRSNKQSQYSLTYKADTTKKGGFVYYFSDANRKKGLKKLGKKNENRELGIYFTIEQKNGELIFMDETPTNGQFVIFGDEKYEIQVPNSLKIAWETNGCKYNTKTSQSPLFYSSNVSSLSNFSGEVEIASTLNNMKLTDVTGPVSINTIGGNVTVEFDKKTPQKLYSIYSNNGFIDITLPESSNVMLDAQGSSIYSDIDFKIEEEKEELGKQQMRLKLKSGNVKMKLNAGLGNIYLRKK